MRSLLRTTYTSLVFPGEIDLKMKGRSYQSSIFGSHRIGFTFCLFCLAGLPSSGIAANITPLRGITLPVTRLHTVDGQVICVGGDASAPTLIVLLAILPENANTPSRRQIVSLRSLQHQYGDRGLRIVAVDRSAAAARPTWNALKNASYDLDLNFPLAQDPGGRLLSATRAEELPESILLGAHGVVQNRWKGVTSSAVLAQGIERIFNGPLARLPSMQGPK